MSICDIHKATTATTCFKKEWLTGKCKWIDECRPPALASSPGVIYHSIFCPHPIIDRSPSPLLWPSPQALLLPLDAQSNVNPRDEWSIPRSAAVTRRSICHPEVCRLSWIISRHKIDSIQLLKAMQQSLICSRRINWGSRVCEVRSVNRLRYNHVRWAFKVKPVTYGVTYKVTYGVTHWQE